MLFDVERARLISEEYEHRVSPANLQHARRVAQQLRTNAMVHLVDQGLSVASTAVMTFWHWGQRLAHSMIAQSP